MKSTCRKLLDEMKSWGWVEIPLEVEQLAARVERVLALHQPVTEWRGLGHDITVCSADGADWPCPTVRLLDGEEM